MSESKHAVFLSYASQDAEAVRRIAEALRAGGVEVWFDQNELVGGDAWDAKIRGQIASCALFVPILSANTQARLEGYFRLEWKLAAQRTHTMAEEKTFLLPVVIDATRDTDAKVPSEFKAVQWTRLPGGETSPAFVARVQQLLGGAVAGGADPGPASPRPAQSSAKVGRRVPATAWMIGAAALLIAGAFVLFRSRQETTTPHAGAGTPPPTTEKPPAAALALPSDKSIAVLPFENLSTEKDNEYFAVGIHGDVLANLQNIRELRVVSEQSVSAYRGSTKKAPDIARELSVAHLLTGKVQRVGDTVRVTAQLVDARTDTLVWFLPPYTKKLTDIFAIQSEIAQAIATALRAKLTPQEQSLIVRRLTENPAAYDAYLKGRTAPPTRIAGAQLQVQEAAFQHAVDLDPNFAEAWGELAAVHARFVRRLVDTSPARIAQADAALAKAISLAPDSPEVLRLSARCATDAHKDHARAAAAFERLTRLQPNDPVAWSELAQVEFSRENWSQVLAHARKATQLDPANIEMASQLVTFCAYGRRWPEAIAEQRRLLKLQPDDLGAQQSLAWRLFLATGDTKPMEAFFAGLTPAQAGSPDMMFARKNWDFLRGDLPHFIQLDRVFPYHPEVFTTEVSPMLHAYGELSALVLLAHGDPAGAKARLGDLPEKLQSDLKRQPNNEGLWISLALTEAILGRREQALEAVRSCLALSTAQRKLGRPYATWRLNAVIAKIWVGAKDEALADLAQLLREPVNTLFVGGTLSVHALRTNALFLPLRGNPRFEALLNDPKNNAPLF